MAARCAACRQPIGTDDKFLISDTEVFHRTCASRVSASLTTQLKLKVLDLQRDLAAARADAAEVPRLRTAIDDANRDARAVRAERDNLERNFQRLHRRLAELDSQRQDNERTIGTQGEMLRSLTARCEAIIADLDRHENRPVEPPEDRREDLDDAAQRFRLLELDPLE